MLYSELNNERLNESENRDSAQDSVQDGVQVSVQDGGFFDLKDIQLRVLNYCIEAKSKREILLDIGLTNHYKNYKTHIELLIDFGLLGMINPEKPTTKSQKYKTTDKGMSCLRSKGLK